MVALLLWHAIGTPAPATAVAQQFPDAAADIWSSQARPQKNNRLPPQVIDWIRQASALEEKGANREALTLQQKAVNWLRANPQQGDATTAGILHAFWRLLWMNDKPVDALAPVAEAVMLRRRLMGISNHAGADLAVSLRLQATLYAALERSQDVLPPIQEAMAIHRRVAERNSSLTVQLAHSLNFLGLLYSALERPAEALPPTIEAATIRRSMAIKDPEEMANLAHALNDPGNR